MFDKWTADVVARLRMFGITQKEFAKLCDYSEPYMSQVLRGHKSTSQAREAINRTLVQLQEKQK